MDYKQYLFPILDGCGVVVGDLAITAGHVIDKSIKTDVMIDEKLHSLIKDDAILFDTNSGKRSDGYDIAVFRLNGVNSPLRLAPECPSAGEELLSVSLKHTINGNLASNIFKSDIKEDWVSELRTGKVITRYDNFFECQFKEALSRGSSGSPILRGNQVMGILYGDKDGKDSSNSVLYLSSSIIVKLLETSGYDK